MFWPASIRGGGAREGFSAAGRASGRSKRRFTTRAAFCRRSMTSSTDAARTSTLFTARSKSPARTPARAAATLSSKSATRHPPASSSSSTPSGFCTEISSCPPLSSNVSPEDSCSVGQEERPAASPAGLGGSCAAKGSRHPVKASAASRLMLEAGSGVKGALRLGREMYLASGLRVRV